MRKTNFIINICALKHDKDLGFQASKIARQQLPAVSVNSSYLNTFNPGKLNIFNSSMLA